MLLPKGNKVARETHPLLLGSFCRTMRDPFVFAAGENGKRRQDKRKRRPAILSAWAKLLRATSTMRQPSPEPARKASLTQDVHSAVARLVAERGEVQTARVLGVSRATVLRGLARLALTYSTRTTIETCLARMGGE